MIPPEVAAAPADAAFGKFVRTEKLGEGGMGEVWKAWDRALARWVALKFTRSVDELERFRREAQLAARLSHPNIASIYEVGDAGGRPWIAMQFVEGSTLKGKRPDARQAALWMRDVARAVQAAHEQGVIHRDLKPDNLMIAAPGPSRTSTETASTVRAAEAERIFVMDFGLARPIERGAGLTQSGIAVGTPSYMPPEQALGQPADARSDVYGLGATLYELLAGRPPFSGDNILDVLTAVCQEEPPRIGAVARDLETIVFTCLEKDPARRYATAAEVAADLDRWLFGEPIQAMAPSVAYRLGKFVQRRKPAMIAAVVAVAAVAVAAAWQVSSLAEREAERKRRDAALAQLEGARTEIARAERLRAQGASRDDIAKALAAARAILAGAKAPSMALVPHLEGLCAELEGDEEKAEAAWRRAVGLDAGFAPSRYRLAMLLVSRALVESVSTTQKQANERLKAAKAAALEAAAALETTGEGQLERELATAAVTWCRGDRPGAARMLTECVRRNAGREGLADLHVLLSQVIDRGPERSAALEAALRESPGHPIARFYRGVERQVAEDAKGAVEDYDRAIAARPRFFWAYLNRCRARRALGDAKGAAGDAVTASEIEPSNLVAIGALALALRESGDSAGSIAACDRGLALDPNSADLWMTRGSTKQRQGDNAGARADYDRAIELEPNHLEALANRGIIRAGGGEIKGGLEDFDRALAVDPKHAFSRHWRGVGRKRAGDVSGAIEDLEIAVTLWPNNASTWFHYAQALASRGRNREAMPAYEKSLALDPKAPDTWASRAVARRALGEIQGALEDVEKALEVAPADWPNRAAAERLREQLKKM